MHTLTDPAGITIEARLEALARLVGHPLPICDHCQQHHAEQLLRMLEQHPGALRALAFAPPASAAERAHPAPSRVAAVANELAAAVTGVAKNLIREPRGRRHAWALHVRDWLMLQIIDKRAAAPAVHRTEAAMWHAFRRVQREVAMSTERGREVVGARAQILREFHRTESYSQMRSERPLFIALRRICFEAFAAGTKTEEYRIAGRNWNEKNCYAGRPVTLSMGYGSHHRLSGVITGFRTQEDGRSLPGWVECYGQRPGPAAIITIRVEGH
jgi:hypothetical protein